MKDNSNPPPPPEQPDPEECCGEGCVPCIFDYYFDRLSEWEERYEISLVEYQVREGKKQAKQ